MSSGTSYDWQLEVERERQRVSALRAEFAQLREREQSLRLLRAAAASQGVRTELPKVHEPAATASSAELRQAVTELRAGLDALEQRLTEVSAERAAQRAARWSVVLTAEASQPTTSPTGVLAAAKATRAAERVRAALAAAQDLVQTEGYRCVPADLADLTARAERIGQLGAGQAAIALQDLEARVSGSIAGRREHERTAQLRARLICLLDEAATHTAPGTPSSATFADLRRRVADAAAADLPGLAADVDTAVHAESRRRARAEVARRLTAALTARGYAVGEGFDDRLGVGGDVVVAACEAAPDYGLRLVIDADQDVLRASVVRRDDAAAHDEEQVQHMVCGDLEVVEQSMGEAGCKLGVTWRRQPQPSVPTMPAEQWPAGLVRIDRDEQTRRLAEHQQRQQARLRAKDSRS